MSHDFSRAPSISKPRSTFQRNSDLHTTFSQGVLNPIYVDEIYPGDTLSMNVATIARLQTPIVPFMDNLYIDVDFFFVPHRILWDNWEKFQGYQRNPGDSTSFTIPQVVSPAGGFAAKSIYDYLGLPTTLSAGKTISVNALPLRALNRIWNDWYRDQNIQSSLPEYTDNGPDPATDYQLSNLIRNKRHDYFTAGLPSPQKGPAVTLPLGTRADVTSQAVNTTVLSAKAPNIGTGWYQMNTAGATLSQTNTADPTAGAGNLYADLSTATAATVTQLRQAFALQQIYELDNRGGTRYVESLLARWGCVSPDFRLQRPEFLGRQSMNMNIHQVPQTAPTVAGQTAQGNLAAFAMSTDSGHVFTYSAVEHGYLIGLASVRSDLRYQRGLDRFWSRLTRFDFYEPSLANLSDQAVLKKELVCTGDTTDNEVFCYQEQFGDLRYKNSKVTGEMRSTYSTPLDMWHLAQNLAPNPLLVSAFMQDNPPLNRVSAVTSQDYIKANFYFQCIHSRVLPVYGVPGLRRL